MCGDAIDFFLRRTTRPAEIGVRLRDQSTIARLGEIRQRRGDVARDLFVDIDPLDRLAAREIKAVEPNDADRVVLVGTEVHHALLLVVDDAPARGFLGDVLEDGERAVDAGWPTA